jgi:hypothetical protein
MRHDFIGCAYSYEPQLPRILHSTDIIRSSNCFDFAAEFRLRKFDSKDEWATKSKGPTVQTLLLCSVLASFSGRPVPRPQTAVRHLFYWHAEKNW